MQHKTRSSSHFWKFFPIKDKASLITIRVSLSRGFHSILAANAEGGRP